MAAAVATMPRDPVKAFCADAREGFLLLIAIVAVGYPSAARADCAMPDSPPGTPAPDAQAGDIAYNIDAAVLQYCNGSNWIAMGGSGGSMPECNDGEMLQYDGGDDEWACVAASALGDNLGNHIATSNIQLGSHWLSGDGGNEGITVDASGNVGVGIAPTHKLHVNGNLGAAASSYLNFGATTGDTGYGIRDNGGTIECKNSGGSWSACVDTTADCTDNSSALCKLQVARATGDPEFIAANIRNATNVLGVSGTLLEKYIDCTNDATVACTLDASRSTSDGQFLAANIKDGVNILGVTGTYTGSGGSGAVTVTTNQNNINLFTLAGSPATPGTYEIIIASGVTIGSLHVSHAAVTTGAFPGGSTVKLTNNGNIYGRGGQGGHGGQQMPPVSGSSSNNGAVGSVGGTALSLNYPLTIDNTNGNIFGGGGGGGGGGMGAGRSASSGGGGGGGGQGSIDSLGGIGGGSVHNCYGASGGVGTVGGGGGGGGRCTSSANNGGAGGAGGAWGAAGSAGANGGLVGSGGGTGAAGGAGGNAILQNGHAVTWLGGNNGTQVKGAVN
jgi:hypothetical protein